MAKCDNCKELTIKTERCVGVEVPFDWCEKKADNPYRNLQRDCPYFKPKTNADRIRSMTDEELAEFLCDFNACCLCEHNDQTCGSKVCEEIGITERWLKSEVGCE